MNLLVYYHKFYSFNFVIIKQNFYKQINSYCINKYY